MKRGDVSEIGRNPKPISHLSTMVIELAHDDDLNLVGLKFRSTHEALNPQETRPDHEAPESTKVENRKAVKWFLLNVHEQGSIEISDKGQSLLRQVFR